MTQQDERIRALLNRGYGNAEIARAIGCTERRVSRVRQNLGFTRSRRGPRADGQPTHQPVVRTRMVVGPWMQDPHGNLCREVRGV